jgi:hypothetical protein
MTPAKTYTREQIKKVFLPHFCEAPLDQILDLLELSNNQVDQPTPAEPEFVEKWTNYSNPLTPYGQAQAILELVESKVKPLQEQIELLKRANQGLDERTLGLQFIGRKP